MFSYFRNEQNFAAAPLETTSRTARELSAHHTILFFSYIHVSHQRPLPTWIDTRDS